jgi:hypothetical protein
VLGLGSIVARGGRVGVADGHREALLLEEANTVNGVALSHELGVFSLPERLDVLHDLVRQLALSSCGVIAHDLLLELAGPQLRAVARELFVLESCLPEGQSCFPSQIGLDDIAHDLDTIRALGVLLLALSRLLDPGENHALWS